MLLGSEWSSKECQSHGSRSGGTQIQLLLYVHANRGAAVLLMAPFEHLQSALSPMPARSVFEAPLTRLLTQLAHQLLVFLWSWPLGLKKIH